MAAENYSVLLKAITATEPTFNFALRGYDRRQVDQYAQRTESQLATTLAENRDLGKQLQAMTAELRAARDELIELRQRPAIGESLSFKHLGMRVEQILTDAQEESAYVRQSATAEAERVRGEALDEAKRERAAAAEEVTQLRAVVAQEVTTTRATLADEMARHREQLTEEIRQTKELRDGVLAELEEARQATAAEEARVVAEVQRSQGELAKIAIETDRTRREADELIALANAEYERVTNSAMETAEKIHADLAVQTTALREEAHAEATTMTQAAQQYASQTIAEAQQHAAEVHELVQKYLSKLGALEAPPSHAGRHGRELSATSMRALSDRPADADGADEPDLAVEPAHAEAQVRLAS